MFTGLVQMVGRVKAVKRRKGSVRLCVDAGDWEYRPGVGDSVSVSGCCLTVVNENPAGSDVLVLEFDVVPETLAKTKLGGLKIGSRVNLEHAARMDTLMGGHLVQGHVDGVARVERVSRTDGWRVRVGVPRADEGRTDEAAGDLMQYIMPKGSVCVDGVSLTVAGLWGATNGRMGGRGFEVALIPETLAKTTLKALKRGDEVNLEVDAMAKTVVHWLKGWGSRDLTQANPSPGPLPLGGGKRRTRARTRD